MLEDVLEGKSPIEEKYLHNFTPYEKERFNLRIGCSSGALAKYQAHLDRLYFEESHSIFCNDDIDGFSTAEEIKYALNRIEANDPRQTAFEVGAMDEVDYSDRFALDIAKAFRNNTACRTVVLNNLSLTANEIDLILRTLHHKDLLELDIRGNKIGECLPTLTYILDDPDTNWGKVKLGKVRLDPEQKEALEQHENVSFTALPPKQKISQVVRNLFQRQ